MIIDHVGYFLLVGLLLFRVQGFRVSYMGGRHSTVELHPSRRFLVGDQELDAGERDEAVKSEVQHHMEPSGVSGGD